MRLAPFHLIVQARDLPEAQRFYGTVFGCREIGMASDSVKFDFHGHQWTCQWNPALGKTGRIAAYYNPIDSHGLPVPRGGLVLPRLQWHALAARLARQQVDFMIEPTIRAVGAAQEEALMLFLDPSGNALEFKSLPAGGASLALRS